MKLLIGTPTYNHQLDSRMVTTVIDIIKEADKRNVALNWDRPCSCLLAYNRNLIVQRALDEEFDWLLFIDADTSADGGEFPFQMIETAFKYDTAIVGAPVMLKFPGKKAWNFCYKKPEGYKNWEGDLPKFPIEADVIGTGIMLIKVDFLKKMKPPWFRQTETYNEELKQPGFFPEDYNLCELAKEMGQKIIVDTNVKTSHHGDFTFTL